MSEPDPKRIKIEIALEAVPDNGIIIDIVGERGQKLQDYKVHPGILMFKVFNNFAMREIWSRETISSISGMRSFPLGGGQVISGWSTAVKFVTFMCWEFSIQRRCLR